MNQFDQRAYGLREVIKNSDAAELQGIEKVSQILLKQIYHSSAQPDHKQQEAFDILKTRFIQDQETLVAFENNEAGLNAWIRALQVLEESGRLKNRDHMKVFTITAMDKELAGEDLAAFAGFFDRRFRDYDYTTGRNRARRFLAELYRLNKTDEGHTGANKYPPLSIEVDSSPLKRDSAIENAIIKKNQSSSDDNNSLMPLVKKDIREKLLERLIERLDRAADQFNFMT